MNFWRANFPDPAINKACRLSALPSLQYKERNTLELRTRHAKATEETVQSLREEVNRGFSGMADGVYAAIGGEFTPGLAGLNNQGLTCLESGSTLALGTAETQQQRTSLTTLLSGSSLSGGAASAAAAASALPPLQDSKALSVAGSSGSGLAKSVAESAPPPAEESKRRKVPFEVLLMQANTRWQADVQSLEAQARALVQRVSGQWSEIEALQERTAKARVEAGCTGQGGWTTADESAVIQKLWEKLESYESVLQALVQEPKQQGSGSGSSSSSGQSSRLSLATHKAKPMGLRGFWGHYGIGL